jgi:hypothetical protein
MYNVSANEGKQGYDSLNSKFDTFIRTTNPEGTLDCPEMLGTYALQPLPYSKNVKIWSMQRSEIIFSAVIYNSSSSLILGFYKTSGRSTRNGVT